MICVERQDSRQGFIFGIHVSSKATKILNINIWNKRVGSATRFALNFPVNFTFSVSFSPAILHLSTVVYRWRHEWFMGQASHKGGLGVNRSHNWLIGSLIYITLFDSFFFHVNSLCVRARLSCLDGRRASIDCVLGVFCNRPAPRHKPS